MDTRIYVCTHKTTTKPDSDLYRIIHAGRRLSNDLGYEGDDTYDNISDKNKSFCELTAMYWIYKNVTCDIVGICHYRRYFVEQNNILSKERIEELLTSYDVILPEDSRIPKGSVAEWYQKTHHAKDLTILQNIIAEKYPDYLEAFHLAMQCNLLCIGNMIITKKEIYDEYCAWLFDLLFEAEKRIDIREYDDYQKRVFGFLAERLVRVFMLMHTYKIYAVNIGSTDFSMMENELRLIELKNKMIRLQVNDLILIYQSGLAYDITEISPLWKPAEGKFPVWSCWWQGRNELPESTRSCVQSIEENLPDQMEFHLLTLDNVSKFFSFPDWILSAYQEGKIPLSTLSEILKAGILYLYGGLWIDPDYYMTHFPVEILHHDFFTIKTDRSLLENRISQGQWSANVLKITPHHLLMRFLLNGYYLYFLKADDPNDASLTDYFIRIAYDQFPEIKQMIDDGSLSGNRFLIRRHRPTP